MADVREYAHDELVALLPLPDSETNKYARGKLISLVGSERYPGAACLAALAGQRMGAGYSEVVTVPKAVDLVRAAGLSLVVRSREKLESNDFETSNAKRPCAYVVGSGFDIENSEAARCTYLTLKNAQAPILVDGGALSVLATEKGRRLLRRRFVRGWPTVVTPHAGEAARLAAPFELSTEDPAELSRLISLVYGVVAMVKGPKTFVSDGEQTTCMSEGTSALAKAGTGDVLAGMTGALLAQGTDTMDACVLAATLHARAGRVAAERLTAICVTAEDVIDMLPAAISSFVEEDGRP